MNKKVLNETGAKGALSENLYGQEMAKSTLHVQEKTLSTSQTKFARGSLPLIRLGDESLLLYLNVARFAEVL